MIRYGTRGWQERPALTTPDRSLSPQRQWWLGATLGLALLGLTGRLAYWQIAQGPQLAQLAHNQQYQRRAVPSGRGAILDHTGALLALTVTRAIVVLDPLIAQDADRQHPGTLTQSAERLSALTGIPTSVILPQLRLATGYRILTEGAGGAIRLGLTDAAAVQTAIDAGSLPGTVLRPQVQRVAPAGNLAGPVLGFVRADTSVGQYGIEERYDALLAGTPGQLTTTVDAVGNPLTADANALAARPGATVTLTLDTTIQALAEDGLRAALSQTGATGGTVIVVNPATGAVLALATTPGFDPQHYADAPLEAYANPAIASVYDPGSTMKAVTMAAGLDSGVITPTTTFNDTGTYAVGGQAIHNWNNLAWGPETMTQILTHSSNVGAAWIAVDRLGRDRFARYLSAFGFGAPTGVDLPGEVAGLLPPPAPTIDLANLDLAENAFGESIGVTPLQMVMAYAAIANGGVLMRPRLVQSTTRDGQTTSFAPTTVRRAISAQTAATLTGMLVTSALHSDAQTGLITGYKVAAKTGTSTPDPRDPSSTYASVLGFAPAEHPRFVLLVKLDHPQGAVLGGEAAGPLWRTLTRQLLALSQVPAQEGN